MKAPHAAVYCDYFSGFKALTAWLAPIQIPTLPANFKFNRMLYNYEQQEIAKIIGCDPAIIQYTLLEIHNELNS